MRQRSPKFDYLEKLVREQMREVQEFGPMAYDILGNLQPPTDRIDVESLVQKILQTHRPVLQVISENLNLRSKPSFDAPTLRVLPQGSQLVLLELGGEVKIGVEGQWLQVVDMHGNQGFVAAWFVAPLEANEKVDEKIDRILHTLQYFNRLDLVMIDQEDQQVTLELTQKGRHVAEMLFEGDWEQES